MPVTELPDTDSTGRTSHPQLVTADATVAGAVLRLAAGAGVPLDVVADPEAAVRAWATAPLVLVGADSGSALATVAPLRRDGVNVVAVGDADDGLFRTALALGAGAVLELPAADRWLVDLLADVGDGARRSAVTVTVVGGSGGVGASVLAGALAVTAAQREATMLVGLDPTGPGLSRLVGLEDASGGTSWADLAGSQGRLGGRALRESLPRAGRLGVLDFGAPAPARSSAVSTPLVPPPALVKEVVAAGRRGHGWLVLDLPRHLPTGGTGVLGLCDHVVLVVRASLGAVTAGARMADQIRDEAPDAGVVVRSRRGSVPTEDVARAVGLPLLAVLRDERRLDEHLDLGLGPVHSRRSPLSTTTRRLVEQWAPR
jgi:secretion/DNA translocation related CpaE-like protein